VNGVVNGTWRCGVCETVNHGGRTCVACGADLTRRSTAATAVRTRLSPRIPPPPAPAPLPEPVRRAIDRDPVPEDEWVEVEYDEPRMSVLPIPGGCLISSGPRIGF
jgi:hypothetical protein